MDAEGPRHRRTVPLTVWMVCEGLPGDPCSHVPSSYSEGRRAFTAQIEVMAGEESRRSVVPGMKLANCASCMCASADPERVPSAPTAEHAVGT
jgi:hypothetical protein